MMLHTRAFIVSTALLVVAVVGSMLAQAATVTCPPAGTMTATSLPPGDGEDLEVTGPCTVGVGTYRYGNVNIYGGGSLAFEDAGIDFWVMSILVENDGSLIAGTPEAPIGTSGGVVTIHLYGPDQGPGTGKGDGGQGILCKSPEDASTGPCGIPLQIWNSNGATKVQLPGGAPDDYFHQYHPLPYDDGGAVPGFFGYKVLAASYGGTLQLFGKKGATYGAVDAANSGTSWVRLAQTLHSGGTTLVLDRPVDWAVGDRIVVTTTDYLPGHSEPLTIASVSADQQTLTVEEPAQYLHNGEAYDLSTLPQRLGGDEDLPDPGGGVLSVGAGGTARALSDPLPSGPQDAAGDLCTRCLGARFDDALDHPTWHPQRHPGAQRWLSVHRAWLLPRGRHGDQQPTPCEHRHLRP
jgi:G8 domain